MRKLTVLLVAAIAGGSVCASLAADAEGLAVWPVDPHVKVFRDAQPPEASGPVTLRAARNEYEPAQVAFRGPKALEDVRVEVTPLAQEDGGATLGPEAVAWSFVGFIPLAKNTTASDTLQLRAAPCEVPDPLLEAATIDVEPNATQPVWITVHVPKDAKPGLYRGEIAVTAGDDRVALPVELVVDPFTLPDERHLSVTNWFNVGNIAKAHGVELWSDAFWAVLERYARNMAAHRQNVAYTPWTLVEITQEADGKLSFDYGRFDRFVELFEKAGAADRIEITHVAHFGPGGWSGKEIVFRKVTATNRETGKSVALGPEEGLAPLLADLVRHLAERGWLEKSMIHVADEPSINNIESWREASEFVHRAAPGLRRIDAIETIDFSGALDVWVPKLSHFDRWREAYEARRGDDEMWYYICCHPYGSVYPNRFLDYPATCVRVLHWINFAEDLSGYLHWGLNFWGDDPFGTPRDGLPPGDTHVIYPGSEGPLSSIRWEIQRESLEDYEYLHLLAAKTAEVKGRLGAAAGWLDPRRRARELCRRVVPSIAEWERDPARIAATRREIADEIIALDRAPLLLVQTEPPGGSTLINGPIVVEVRGIVEPGTTVTVGGRRAEVRADGTFACTAHPSGETGELAIEAEREGQKKSTVRRFEMRR
ncbi:MAG TPA: glycoside hydrolase domain-containing protein [Thermoguttaceae bacterium]|nr:glycoside hydrolase domain-containing protein [Thermoguttaceae bacterium]